MATALHSFHIPVMGTGFSLDTPLRVGRFGIASVMSLVDDALIERVRRHYTAQADLPFTAIGTLEPDARARRITAWLDLVHDLLAWQMDALRALPFASGESNDKTKYFELLPDESPLRRAYDAFLGMQPGHDRERAGEKLARAMAAGSADVNIMTKLDRPRTGPDGAALAPDQSDAKAALRGFAASRLQSRLILSAGMNPTLFGTLERFPAFYRDDQGHVAKGIILKVSDFRSALVQAKFLAKKGLEVQELRIESGLNCGGHLFATDGELLGPILAEFQERLGELRDACEPAVRQYYDKHGKPFVGEARRPRVTVQGGLGTAGEVRRLREHYGADATGWGTPFLLVREATALDDATRAQLAAATEDDLYVSQASPLGIPFNNLRGSSSELWMKRQIDQGHPGSLCPRGYLASNTDFTQAPVCTASREYQTAKLHALGFATPPPSGTTEPAAKAVYAKACICNHLGNGALMDLGIMGAGLPVAVCPGPNIAWFDREYTLREMVDHIYGRGESLVPAARPHCLAKELEMVVDHFLGQVAAMTPGDTKARDRLAKTEENLQRGLAHYRELMKQPAYAGENLASLAQAVELQARRIEDAWHQAPPPLLHELQVGAQAI
jgi:NAD(P)H-dependent flavin oxidoreductase YrpB (nitropropane dioxygenase family)